MSVEPTKTTTTGSIDSQSGHIKPVLHDETTARLIALCSTAERRIGIARALLISGDLDSVASLINDAYADIGAAHTLVQRA